MVGPEKATQMDISQFKKYSGKTFKPRTVALTFSQLRAIYPFFPFFMTQGFIPDNPVEFIDPVPTPPPTPKWLTRND
ncbi:hypothetical protein GJ688_17200 [Heliobacillus mobilis]|uniref:Uncharacterized protein n=1 Tax=Heliobacterium mobile TaxID=28064 RepID=A0A6I3SPQ6_HELMO|nr:hypothetical protein [Heliobacterium mobile]MTV50675.1 hypothetical protein [Heliobacterium mobile]